jgi:DNA-binding LacI/PurR family transcriptional regulator
VTLADIAARLGLSTTTVSDALSGNGRIPDATRHRVIAMAQQLGYVANTAARHLRGGRAGALGLYMPETLGALNYYLRFSFGMVAQASGTGYEVVLMSAEALRHSGRLPAVDGVVAIDLEKGDPTIAALKALEVPIVAGEGFGGDRHGISGAVVPDHGRSLTKLMDHLADNGATRPALLIPQPRWEWAKAVRTTYRRWCARHGKEPIVVDLEFSDSSEKLASAASALLQQNSTVDALICGPDATALAVPGIAASLGRSVRRDLLYASCIDSPTIALSDPAVTAIDVRPHAFGAACTELLIDICEQRESPYARKTFTTELILRESSTHLPDTKRSGARE